VRDRVLTSRHTALAAFLALNSLTASAQNEPASITAGYAVAYDRFRYRFENPSTFDSAERVAHNFEQTYWGDNQWITIAARYHAGHRRFETMFAATPVRETRGDDIDTFFLSNGDVATSGTSGRVDMRSFRIRQDIVVATLAGLSWHGAYQFSRDRQVFHARQMKTVTHSSPPSSTTFAIDGAETTISEVHAFAVGVSRTWDAPWKVVARIDVAPSTYARLTTRLPFKYPDRDIVFAAPVVLVNPSLSVTRGSRWPFTIAAGAVKSFNYAQNRQFLQTAVLISASAAFTR
jgi:hypothetical protein